MSQTGRPRYSLRSAVRAGQASPPPSLWSPGAVSPTTGTPGTDRASTAVPKSRSVSPELLYSEVASHRPTLRKEGGIPQSGSPSAVVSSGNVPDEPSVPALNPDVDWVCLITIMLQGLIMMVIPRRRMLTVCAPLLITRRSQCRRCPRLYVR
jgi:hypothetical protein